MSLGEVYMIRHNITGRMYIGKSDELQKRLKAHFCALRHGRHPVEDMQKDFDDYGEAYTINILGELCNGRSEFEYAMMDKYHSTVRGIGYNYKDPHARKHRVKKERDTA